MSKLLKDTVFEWVKIILTAIVIAIIITQFIRPTLVRGESMYPTLEENDYLIISKISYKIKSPKTGDIIVFKTNLLQEDGTHKDLVKRVIATEGNHLVIKDSKVYVDYKLLDEPYIHNQYTTGDIDIIIPENKIFAMGDNREKSLDSRYEEVGLVDESDVIGKVTVRLYPFDKIGIVK
ncbi:signal peptidase I [Romboutsia sp. Marseille-P6047]|uniref:signal peptidase I n=1 Tax=Romboutsia sp. Marseille-P6047 TaxID=2161817 RepID=UPI000F06F3AC|nr:signal peptidase I [Romboutsia sp. Marseille-P6047]